MNLGAIIIDELRVAFLQRVFNSIGKKQSLIDVGCGEKPYLNIYSPFVEKSVGVDVNYTLHKENKADVFFDGKKIPFEDNSFDIVICTEVLEHVQEPKEFVAELKRVVKPNGYIVLTVPFSQGLHEVPYDYYRYTQFSLEYMALNQQLKIEELYAYGNWSGNVLLLLVQMQLKFWNKFKKAVRIPAIYSLWNPFILLFVYAPQKLYVLLHGAKNTTASLNPIGYGILLRK